jgi:hypothetical protein
MHSPPPQAQPAGRAALRYRSAMKLRIRGNSLRLRITRPELERLAGGGPVVETVSFPAGAELRYELAVDARAAAIAADYRNDTLRVTIPTAEFSHWQRQDQVALRGVQPSGRGAELAILLEKDFPCPDARPGEDDSQAFERPGSAQSR